jgi:ABC-type multidrug transport system ATPase subunit
MAGATVELEQVGKRYGVGGPWVFKDVDLALDGGSVVELAGVNGAGKSTLLRILSGATLPSSGRRLVAREVGPGLGYMPERLTAPALSAATYLRHHVRLRGLEPHAGDKQVSDLADSLEARQLLAEPMAALSKGSLQKVVAIQCLLGSPRVLVLDEPFASLDARARQTLWRLMAMRAHDGAAVMFCDHHDWSGRQADRRFVLSDGVLAEESSAAPPASPGRESPERRVRRVVGHGETDREISRLIDDGWHVVRVSERPSGGIEIEAVRRDPPR